MNTPVCNYCGESRDIQGINGCNHICWPENLSFDAKVANRLPVGDVPDGTYVVTVFVDVGTEQPVAVGMLWNPSMGFDLDDFLDNVARKLSIERSRVSL